MVEIKADHLLDLLKNQPAYGAYTSVIQPASIVDKDIHASYHKPEKLHTLAPAMEEHLKDITKHATDIENSKKDSVPYEKASENLITSGEKAQTALHNAKPHIEQSKKDLRALYEKEYASLTNDADRTALKTQYSELERAHDTALQRIEAEQKNIKKLSGVDPVSHSAESKLANEGMGKFAKMARNGNTILEGEYNKLGKVGKFAVATTANFAKPAGFLGNAVKVARASTAIGSAAVAVNGGIKMFQGATGAEIGVDPVTNEKQVADSGTFLQGLAQTAIAVPVGITALVYGGRAKALAGFAR